MDLDALISLIEKVDEEINRIHLSTSRFTILTSDVFLPKIDNILNISHALLPDHIEYIKSISQKIHQDYTSFYSTDARYMLEHLLFLINLEKGSQEKIKDLKIFDSAFDKVQYAGECFRNTDFPGVFNNLNTALELILKDKVDVPSTLKNVNTSNIIEILVKEKVTNFQYLDEAKNRVVFITNNIKHHGYAPSQTEAINAIRIMEELISKIKDINWNLSDNVKEKIFKKLY